MRNLLFWRWRHIQDDDLDRELAVHLDLAAEERLDAGVPPREAKLAAQRAFGSVALAKEDVRETRTGAALERLSGEVLQAARRLMRSPAFTLATVLTLALAIGANVSIFAVVQRVLLNPLPYGDPDRLIAIDFGWPSRNIQSGMNSITTQIYYQYLDHAKTLDGMSVYQPYDVTLSGGADPERIRGARTTPSLAALLDVSPELGRWFTEAEGLPGAAPVAVLSQRLWARRYGHDSTVDGRSVVLNGVPTDVIGVMSASFVFPDPLIDIWVPEPLSRAMVSDAYGMALMLGVIGIYGAMSYIVSQRTGEIGVRLALGAEPGSVARMIVMQGGLVAIFGLIVGLVIAIGGSRLIESLLYRVSPRDPGVFIAMTGLLLGVALLACWLPARRAGHLSPLEALRID